MRLVRIRDGSLLIVADSREDEVVLDGAASDWALLGQLHLVRLDEVRTARLDPARVMYEAPTPPAEAAT